MRRRDSLITLSLPLFLGGGTCAGAAFGSFGLARAAFAVAFGGQPPLLLSRTQ